MGFLADNNCFFAKYNLQILMELRMLGWMKVEKSVGMRKKKKIGGLMQ